MKASAAMAEQSGRRTRDAFTIRKILACFGPSTLATGAIESAVDLAARLDAELETLFVEDTAVLQLTELPFVRELTLPGLQALPLSRRNLELQCRVLAREAEGRLAEIAASRRLRWSFRIARGRILAEAAAGAARSDLLALGFRTRPIARESRLDPSVQSLIGAVSATILLLRPECPPGHPVYVVIETASEADKLIAAAAAIADPRPRGPVATVWAAGRSLERQLADRVAAAHVMGLRSLPAPEEIEDLMGPVAGGTLVLSASSMLLRLESWRPRIGGARCTLLLVR
jgi:hypothetical protein